MPRGYRYAIVAALGWLSLTGAAPRENYDTANNSAIREADKAPEQDRGCKPGKDDHKSDLCAQWKAADAAQEAANYSFWTLIGTTIGTGLLVWTLWETRSATRRELRAYIAVKPTNMNMHKHGDGIVSIEIKINNLGSTPAYDCIHAGNIVILDTNVAERYFSKENNAPRIGRRASYVLSGGEGKDGEIIAQVPFTQKDIDDARSGKRTLYAFGFSEYRDVFNIERRTEFCYSIPPGFVQPEIGEGGDPVMVPMEWLLEPFHNSAT
jgi:hypothetical protein